MPWTMMVITDGGPDDNEGKIGTRIENKVPARLFCPTSRTTEKCAHRRGSTFRTLRDEKGLLKGIEEILNKTVRNAFPLELN